MTKRELSLFGELVRLQTLLLLWPTPAGRYEFNTELHLKRALQHAHDKWLDQKEG